MSRFDLIIFDCDGVLVDSEILAAQVEAKLLSDAGYPITAGEIGERFAGMTWRDILLAVEKEAAIPLQAALFDQAYQALGERLKRELQPIEGVRAAVSQLSEPRCVCSNSTEERIDMMLTKVGLIDLFRPNIFSAESLGPDRVKPKPDVFLHGAEKMGAAPKKTLVIEDSVHGITGAKAAGMRVIGFTGGAHTYPSHADRLTDAGAETVIHRMEDLPAVATALLEWSDLD
ncbi:HAD family hydrolase [Martelella endophytica]|uniref:HAD family hydrolase n=1 Tax=Martelella endophytica TaxID=1486262 RepID=A0A0D5LSR2_MAREN|nr:HAD family phosphatase [Martelella endophytica]AJY46388.1 HAD family hydrolase [Martelella endophytica]